MASENPCDICNLEFSEKRWPIDMTNECSLCTNCWENIRLRLRKLAVELIEKAKEKGNPYE